MPGRRRVPVSLSCSCPLWIALVLTLLLAGAPAASAANPAAAVLAPSRALLPPVALGQRPAGPVATVPADVLSASMAKVAGQAPWVPEPPVYSVYTSFNLPVRMTDGVVLRINVLFPADPASGVPAVGTFPVLLTQTPYGKAVSGAEPGLVQRGFIEVVADVRGTGDSHGQWGLLDPQQIDDGVTLVHWAAALPHSNGSVGLFGASYLGINQLLTAAAVGPHSPLKAIFPVVAASDVYRDMAVMGGIPDAEFFDAFLGLTAGLNAAGPAREATAQGPPDRGNLGETLDVERDHLGGLGGFHASYLSNLAQGGDLAFDGPYWEQRRPQRALSAIVANRIPAYLVGGWNDLFQRGEPLNYSGLQNAWAGRPVDAPMLAGQPVTGRYQLLMGPWSHANWGTGVDLGQLELQWFDTWLRGEPTGVDRTPTPLHLYQLGGNRWVDAARWPLPGARAQRLYLGGGRTGLAPWSLNDGTLGPLPEPVNASEPVAFTGASSPCSRATDQWAGGLLSAQFAATTQPQPCAVDDRTLQVGPGVLTYTGAALAQPLVIAGPIGVTLFATSTTDDAEWVVDVDDVAPDGVSRTLTQGALLGSLRALDRDSWTAADGGLLLPHHPLTRASAMAVSPGQVTEFDVEVYPIFAELGKGHSLRVTVSTSDTPHLVPTAAQAAHLVGGVYQVLRGGGAPSYIELPVAG